MPQFYQNIHGRRPGRGLRPWLLIPKVLAVGLLWGSLVSVTVLWCYHLYTRPDPRKFPSEYLLSEYTSAESPEFSPPAGPPEGPPEGLLSEGHRMPALGVIEYISFTLRFITLPALLVAVVFGVMLFVQHPRQFFRLRWWQVKVVSMLVGLPIAYLFISSRLALLRQATLGHTPDHAAESQLTIGLLVLLVSTVWIVFLGRMKPRLGQNWANTYQKINHPPRNPDSFEGPKP